MTPSSMTDWSIHSKEKMTYKGLPMLEGLPWDREDQHCPPGQIGSRADVLSDIKTKSKVE